MLGGHLLGIYEKAFDEEESLEAILEKAKRLDFDFVELSIDESDKRLDRLYWDKKNVENLRRACFDAGIGFQSMCLSGHRKFPFGSSDAVTRKIAHDVMLRALDLALALGIRVIQLAGYDVYYEESTPESVKLFREGIGWAVSEAEKRQIMLAMEVMDTPFINSISKNQYYEAMLDSPWFHTYPDLGNLSAWPENDVTYELEKGIHSIVGIHLKDTIKVAADTPGVFKKVPFGEGCVDFASCFGLLESLGYKGPYMIEMWHEKGISDTETVENAKKWIEEQYKKGTQKS